MTVKYNFYPRRLGTLNVEEVHLLKVLYAESSNTWGKRAVYVLKQLTVKQSS